MPFSISPMAYINMLNAIPVSLPRGGACQAAIRKYRCEAMVNGGARAGLKFVEAVQNSARSLRLQLESNGGPDFFITRENRRRAAASARPNRPPLPPLTQTNALDMRRAVTGKATIDQFRSVLTNLAIWLDHGGAAHLREVVWPEKHSFWGMHEGRRHMGRAFVEELLGPRTIPQKLQLIADTFFGLDCNGFVGTWMRINGYRKDAESPIEGYFTEAQAIASVDQIVPYMVIRFDHNKHINIIESAGADRNHWNICGSELGGIGRWPYTITPVRGQAKRFRVRSANGMASSAALIGPADPASVQRPA